MTVRKFITGGVFNKGKARILHPMLGISMVLALLFGWIFGYYPTMFRKETKEIKYKLW